MQCIHIVFYIIAIAMSVYGINFFIHFLILLQKPLFFTESLPPRTASRNARAPGHSARRDRLDRPSEEQTTGMSLGRTHSRARAWGREEGRESDALGAQPWRLLWPRQRQRERSGQTLLSGPPTGAFRLCKRRRYRRLAEEQTVSLEPPAK